MKTGSIFPCFNGKGKWEGGVERIGVGGTRRIEERRGYPGTDGSVIMKNGYMK